jgi:monovalent cation:H+ antiporter-2, CPA2 family
MADAAPPPGAHEMLRDLLVVLGVALAVVSGLRQLRVPAVVGFLVAGVVLGPGGLRLVKDIHTIELLAEAGVVFLLFSIGLKFPLRDLVRMRGLIFGAGGLQVGLTVALVTGLLAVTGGVAWNLGIFVGFLVAMSSTAIVLKLLEDDGQVDSLHGRLILSVLVFQDLAVVPCMLVTPLLAGKSAGPLDATKTVLGSVAGIIVILAAARWVLPQVLHFMARTRSRELFTLAAFGAALGTAWLAGAAGLSLSLGAFLAGLVLSESDYAHQLATEVAPLRDALSSLFFISVGMLVDPRTWVDARIAGLLLATTAAIIVVKLGVVTVVAAGMGFGPRMAMLGGLGLAQIGEFSFILAAAGLKEGLITQAQHQQFIGASVVTMALTPLFLALGRRLATGGHHQVAWLERALGAKAKEAAPGEVEASGHGPDLNIADHVIVVGYGVNGKNIVRVLRLLEARYCILELNPYTVRALRDAGETALYGDSTRDTVLRHAAIDKARVLVVAISDPVSSKHTVAVARRLRPDLKIFVRARYVAEAEELRRLGATEVAAEEFETSLELVSVVMAAYGAPERVIQREREELRDQFSHPSRKRRQRRTLQALTTAADVDEVELPRGAAAVGQSLKELDLRVRAGTSIVAVSRRGELIGNPPATFVLEAGDIVFLFGAAREIEAAGALLTAGGVEGTSERLPVAGRPTAESAPEIPIPELPPP